MNDWAVTIIEDEIKWYSDRIKDHKQSDNYQQAAECSEAIVALKSILRKLKSEPTNQLPQSQNTTN